ncbi:hypothetical protein J437_LFUL002635, partial [Ladona fulva]
MSSLKHEDVLMKVRNKLNETSVKLWLQPYYSDDTGSCEEEIKKIALNLSKELEVDVETVIAALKDLQTNAVEKLSAREKFQKTGVATLKVRVSANKRDAVNILTVEILLTENGRRLKEILAERLGTTSERLKVISGGRVLNDDTQLCSQSVKNGMQLMVLLLDGSDNKTQEVEKGESQLNSVKADVNLLSGQRNVDSSFYIQIADQSGKPLQLPKEEERALSVAMTLHEKGRAALKSEDYSLALVFFLEADKEFSHCNSTLLQSVDNYALLSLDIAWCYLCLKNVSQIPNATERLRKCEESFHKSYGTNLERLLVIKGATGNEAALFFRLHLIQAIVLYHEGKREEAARLLQRAEREYNVLKVDEDSMVNLMELGYSAYEARLALRATHGDVNRAVETIEQKHKEKKELQEKEKLERSLGLCKDGKQWVNIKAYHLLTTSMGFDPPLAAAALRLSNNATPLAVQMLQDQVDVVEEEVENYSSSRGCKKTVLKKLTDMGFDTKLAKFALKKCKWNPERAIEFLTQGTDFEDIASSSDEESSIAQAKRRREEAEAYKRISE